MRPLEYRLASSKINAYKYAGRQLQWNLILLIAFLVLK
jgi:hypothetical protein